MPTFLDHVDFAKSEARNLVIHKLATPPSSPVAGQIYYDTVLNKQGTYNGTSWDYVGSGAVTSVSATAPIISTGGTTPTLSIDVSIVPKKFSQTIGDGTATTITVIHNLNNPTPEAVLSLVVSPFLRVHPSILYPTVNTASFTFALPPSAAQYRVTLIG